MKALFLLLFFVISDSRAGSVNAYQDMERDIARINSLLESNYGDLSVVQRINIQNDLNDLDRLSNSRLNPQPDPDHQP